MNRHPIIIKGRQSCRRGDGIQSNHTRASPIIRWAGSRNGHYPALLSSIARISPIFTAIPAVICSSRTCIFPASLDHHLRGEPIGNRYIADMYHLPSMIGLSIAPPPPGRGTPSRPAQPWLPAGPSQAADCAENSPQRPSFGQTGRKAIFPWNGGLTPVRGIINIRSVSTRQAIPP